MPGSPKLQVRRAHTSSWWAVAALALAVAACAQPDPSGERPLEDTVPPQTDPQPPPPTEPPPAVPADELTQVLVHFTRDEEPVAVERQVAPPAVLREALEQQLAGPTREERETLGLTSWFSEETEGMLRRVTVGEQGRAVVDFEDFSRIISGASTSAGGRILIRELNATVFQFPTVRSVEYRLAGSCEAFWNWLQSECHIVERDEGARAR